LVAVNCTGPITVPVRLSGTKLAELEKFSVACVLLVTVTLNVSTPVFEIHCRVIPGTNPVPVKVPATEELAAGSDAGLKDVRVGPGLATVTMTEFDAPPPGLGLTTRTDSVVGELSCAVVRVALRVAESTKLVT
jgi:hypothetical protein